MQGDVSLGNLLELIGDGAVELAEERQLLEDLNLVLLALDAADDVLDRSLDAA